MPKKYLILKLSSFGDIIHAFPALEALKRHGLEVEFDWLVDSSFKSLPGLCSGVGQVFDIPLRLRASNKTKTQAFRSLFASISSLKKQLKAQNYTGIIDIQGLMKSGFLAKLLLPQVPIHGFGVQNLKEKLVATCYSHRYQVAEDHTLWKIYELMGKAMGLELDKNIETLDYAIEPKLGYWEEQASLTFLKTHYLKLQKLASQYLAVIPDSTWISKNFDSQFWQKCEEYLLKKQLGYFFLVFSDEQQEQWSKTLLWPQTIVRFRNVFELLLILAQSRGVIGVDTGPSHLAVALSKPTLGLFSATDPAKTGLVGLNASHAISQARCFPCSKRQCPLKDKNLKYNCFRHFPIEASLEAFLHKIQ